MKRLLANRPRDLALFTLGINTTLRASDLLLITEGQVRHLHRTVFNTDIPTLVQMFNHSSQRQPLTDLGIQPSEIKEAYPRAI
jgi:hypothetical protein